MKPLAKTSAPTIPLDLLPDELRELPALVAELRDEVTRLKNGVGLPEKPRIIWTSKKAYAQHRGVSIRTVSTWLSEGMPAEGSPLRIHVETADRWLADRTSARARRTGA